MTLYMGAYFSGDPYHDPRYAGKLSKLYPEDPFQALLVDEILGAIEDIISAIVPSLREPDEEKRVRL